MTAISPSAERAVSAVSRRRRGRRFGRFGGTLAVLAAGAAMLAPSANAALQPCSPLGFEGSDARSLCAHITGIDAGSTLKVRSAPSLSANVVGRLRNHAIVEVDCWTKGTPSHGDPYWVGLYGPAGPTYVNDWYVTTGNPAAWTKQVPHC
ncbi:MAG: hypothetical protein QOD83_4184 [Solirubrobacteraceae bacterium]|jgi:hypothetical protein|nr:hypothetical protein [Solirubrobacteraceae bacterium]